MADPDAQLGALLAAARATADAAAPFLPGDQGPAGELAAKADHLAACVYAVAGMCQAGRLPTAWGGGR